MPRRMLRKEQPSQIAIFKYLRRLMAEQNYSQFLAFHPANGGKRTEYEAMIFKEMGVMPGVADIILLFAAQNRPVIDETLSVPLEGKTVFHPIKNAGRPLKTVFVELKFVEQGKKTGGQSPNQKLFQERVEGLGFEYHLLGVSNPYDAVAKIKGLLKSHNITAI